MVRSAMPGSLRAVSRPASRLMARSDTRSRGRVTLTLAIQPSPASRKGKAFSAAHLMVSVVWDDVPMDVASGGGSDSAVSPADAHAIGASGHAPHRASSHDFID